MRFVLYKIISHPWQVFTGQFVIVTTEEETIVKLMELLMSLEEVHNIITNLRNEEIVRRERTTFHNVIFFDTFSLFGTFILMKGHNFLC